MSLLEMDIPVYTGSSLRMYSSSSDHSLFEYRFNYNHYIYFSFCRFLSSSFLPTTIILILTLVLIIITLITIQDMNKEQPRDKPSTKHETPKTTTDPIEVDVHGLKAKFFLNRQLQDIIPKKYLAKAEQPRTLITTFFHHSSLVISCALTRE